MQELNAAHPQLAPLREKYGLGATAGLARAGMSHSGLAPMAASMLMLHLVSGDGGGAEQRLQKPVPGELPLIAKNLHFICSLTVHLASLHHGRRVDFLRAIPTQVSAAG